MQKIISEINLKNLITNAKRFKSLTKTNLCAVIKANAYGHGIEEVALALNGTASMFAVALVDEAVSVRVAVGDKDILILTPPTTCFQIIEILKNNFIFSVSDKKTLKKIIFLSEKNKIKPRIHIQVNTGMNRYGFNIDEIDDVCCFSKKHDVDLCGIYSHFYSVDENITKKQYASFITAKNIFKKYFQKGICHISATYGALYGKKYALDMVRVGIGLYGYLPGNLSIDLTNKIKLKKVMKIYAPFIFKRKYKSGGIGYGIIDKTPVLNSNISILRYGYGDGFLRNKNNGTNGCQYNLNNLCMDVCLRKDNINNKFIEIMNDADRTAEMTDRISYEVLCLSTIRAEFRYVYK